MDLKFLGTGNCAGVPVFGCSCSACTKARVSPTLVRRPSCGRISTPRVKLLIDAGRMDLAELLEREPVDRILLTHYHVDHVQGLFHLRWGVSRTPLPVHGPDDPAGCADLLNHPGILDFSAVLQPFKAEKFSDVTVTPLVLNHSKKTLGYAIEHKGRKMAWLTDTSSLPVETLNFLKDWSATTIVIDCTFPPLTNQHHNHNDIGAVLKLQEALQPRAMWLTHINHDLDLWLLDNASSLPEGMFIARDDKDIRC